MADDIYGYRRNPKPRAVLSTEDSMLTFANIANPIGHMIQNWNVSYQQEVREIFELGSSAMYWIKGRPVGQGVLGRIIGAVGSSVGLFPPEAFDICRGGALLRITASSSQCDAAAGQTPASLSLELDGCVVANIGFSMGVQDLTVQENVAFRFAKLSVAP